MNYVDIFPSNNKNLHNVVVYLHIFLRAGHICILVYIFIHVFFSCPALISLQFFSQVTHTLF